MLFDSGNDPRLSFGEFENVAVFAACCVSSSDGKGELDIVELLIPTVYVKFVEPALIDP
jgi:hypothetical protein